ncbi:transglutaminase-like domain-containing protein [Tahibacter amnicola]|uniref:Transglutaminase-like domain-containing protein n=1 Tax=Tahibacter amnicola TaxID=2976241 RepID=A0ABY6BC11_9GAMM|nr:transglutaminase-like domain-containing protein [Tahibacter amnicola]UXI67239.1 transglutaminase-like domain-containing protein [Tahibacter amnicola]
MRIWQAPLLVVLDMALRGTRSGGTFWLLATAPVLLALSCPAFGSEIASSAIEHAGTRHGTETVERSERDGVIQMRRNIHVRVEGLVQQSVVLEEQSVETAQGLPVSLRYASRAGTAGVNATVTVKGNRLLWEHRRGSRTQRDNLPLPPELLFPAALERRIAAQPREQRWTFDYDEVDPRDGQLRRVNLRSDGFVLDGMMEITRSTGPGSTVRMYWSPSQRRLVSSLNLLGTVFRMRPCSKECEGDVVPFAMMDSLSVAFPYRLSDDAMKGTIRYVIESKDDELVLPSTREQTVVARGRRSVVTVCADCGTEPVPQAGELVALRKPSQWLQSDDARIKSLAKAAPRNISVEAQMRMLVRQVQAHMTGPSDLLGYATALEAFESRSGDCTEFAILLAALARANGIATRVVSGLVYSRSLAGKRDSFVPHMWVQAWTGTRWASFDAALGNFDASHIAVQIGDGSPQAYSGVLEAIRGLRFVAAGAVAEKPEGPTGPPE